MKTKLTLSIDQEKIDKIKRFSKKNGRSVSKFVEDFIDEIDKKNQRKNWTSQKL